MKFILNEKFKLDERFILNEAASTDDLKNNLDALVALLASPSYDLSKLDSAGANAETKETLKEIKERADKALTTKDIATIKATINSYIKVFKQKIINWETQPKIKEAVNNLQKSIDSFKIEDLDPSEESALATSYKVFSELVDAQLNGGGVAANKDFARYTDTINKLKEIQEHLTTDKETIIKLLKTPTDIDNFNSSMVEFLNSLPETLIITKSDIGLESDTKSVDVDTTIQNLADIVAPVQKFRTEYANIVTTLKARRGGKNLTALDSHSKDWAALYKECTDEADYENFWKEYYNSEWGKAAEKVKSFKPAFTIELKELGFDAKNNPFISYLKDQNRYEWFTPEKYAILHNAAADGILTENDLFGKGVFGAFNLIFLKNWADKNTQDMKSYLELQLRLKNANLPSAEAAIYQQAPGAYLHSKFLDTNNNLKSITDISGELKQLGASEEIKQPLSQEEIAKKLEIVKDDKDRAKRLISVLLSLFALSSQSIIDDINKKLRPTLYELAKLANIQDLQKAINDCIQLFELNTKKLSNKQLSFILQTLAKYATGNA